MTETLDIRRVWPDVTKRGDPFAVIVVRRPGQFQPFTLTTFSVWMIALCERAREKAEPLTLTWNASADGKYKDLIDAEWPQ